jgi:hypothetical protein
MTTEIGVWQLVDGQLEALDTSMVEAGRKEVEDLEQWIKGNPAVLGGNLAIIGEQVPTKTGSIDFLAIDKSGNLTVIELKRDKLPREALAQAMDYASDVATWDVDAVGEVCLKYADQRIEDFLNENFEDIDLENLAINSVQRILLVGFSVEEPLQRMIEWLSDSFSVSINAIVLRYIKTRSGDELIARTMIIPEEIEIERARKRQIKISMSDEPGTYDEEELEALLRSYLSENRLTPRRMKEIVLPLCLSHEVVTRDMIKRGLIEKGEAPDEGKAGIILTTISREIGISQRDYLRQIIRYEKPNPWEKENYRLVAEYKDLVASLLDESADDEMSSTAG